MFRTAAEDFFGGAMSEKRNRIIFWFCGLGFMFLAGWEAARAKDRLAQTWQGASGDVGQVSMEPPRVALTFDDGPNSQYTETLLDGLRERKVQATFFLLGENIEGNEALVQRMQEEGHLIGNHTYSHVKLTSLSVSDACEELLKTSRLVKSITGHGTEFMRPPFGEWEKVMECGIGMFPVLWNVDTRDWTTENVTEIIRRGTSGIKDGSMILMHDYYESSVEAALKIVDTLEARGFVFVTVDELLLE